MKNVFTTLTFLLVLTISVTAQIGRVGINTTTPAAMLHVKDSSVVFTGGEFNLTSPPPVSGNGLRMMWYPARAAFRTGNVTGDQWDQNNIGLSSFAAGNNAVAFGDQSFASGLDVYAIGANSFASGNLASANGAQSFATGINTLAFGENSFASGQITTAHGTNSFATGYFTWAGLNGFATGYQTSASGTNSLAAGSQSIAMQDLTTTIGYGLVANTNNLFAIGRFNAFTGDNPEWSDIDQLFAVGNGTSFENRKNAFTILKGGNVGIGVTNPTNTLDIKQGSNRAFWPSELPLYVTGDILADSAGIEFRHNNGTQGIGFGYNTIYATGINQSQSLGLKARGPNGFLKFSIDTNERMRITQMGNVGIGTSSPNAPLHITNGTGASNNSLSGYAVFGQTNALNMVFDNNKILARNNSLNATLHLQSIGGDLSLCNGNGKVGIGNVTPSSKLHVTGGIGASYSSSSGYTVFGPTTGANMVFDDNEILGRDNGGSSTLYLQGPGGDLSLCNGSGKVGIGNTTPSAKLHVTGGAEAGLLSNGFLQLGATNGLNIVFDENEILARNGVNAADLSLQADGGNVRIGQTTGVNMAFDNNEIYVLENGIPSPFSTMYLQNQGGDLRLGSNTGGVSIGNVSPVEKLTVSGGGYFVGAVTACDGFLACSDIRYKTNIKPIENALQNVKALHGITYDWNKEKFPEKDFNDRHQIGISAQELEKVYPEMVFTDASGYKTVDYSRLAPVLIEAVKEQQQQIDELKQQVKELLEISRESALAKKP